MQRKYRDRLLKLADFLDKLPRKLFNLEEVVSCHGDPQEKMLQCLENKCGSVACAIGWSPACFPRKIKWEGRPLGGDVVLRNGSSENWRETAEKFFGLSMDEINYLFTPDYYEPNPTPKQVAKVIRKFVSDGKYRVGGYYEDKWEVRPAG